ncbi:putative hydrolase [Vibrio aerogenes CECT 7868]|uniref:Putative hydrolase n=1 Tax=Vibrio aerogenes CECT 7868 TaxID=1216006 RepID=A0A1M5U3C3_9VIBR|nr:hydrolase [Vibrio aerogenes]SHH57522.1 putative hydrolase [Vibrio aerogenes CECT 7868]
MKTLCFKPASGGVNPHTQTLLPRFIRKKNLFIPHWETITTPDDDVLDIAWSENPHAEPAQNKPLFILFHGLEGSFNSPYANGLMHAFAQQGWLAVMMHFRGCSGKPNLQARAYHSGETADPRHFLQMVAERFPDTYKTATGISLGGNMLANYLVEFAEDPLIDSATIISAPFDLAACSERINGGFSKIYQRYLLGSLKKNALQRLQILRQKIPVTAGEIQSIPTLRKFDDLITAPLHGFSDATHYYHQCSAIHKLNHIRLPTLIIHSRDDPFMTDSVIPSAPLPEAVNYQLLDHGGHVGFLSGSLFKPTFWLEQILPTYYAKHVE